MRSVWHQSKAPQEVCDFKSIFAAFIIGVASQTVAIFILSTPFFCFFMPPVPFTPEIVHLGRFSKGKAKLLQEGLSDKVDNKCLPNCLIIRLVDASNEKEGDNCKTERWSEIVSRFP